MSVRMLVLLLILLVLPALNTRADDGPPETEIPVSKDVIAGLDHLLTLVGSGSGSTLDIDRLDPLMAFIRSNDSKTTRYVMQNRPDMSSAFYQFDIRSDLRRILDVGYHPDIPAHILSPSSIRLSYWKSVNGNGQTLPRMSDKLSGLNQPFVVKGVEYEEITPDQFTGTYYAYDVDRTLILTRYQGRNMLISLSKQENLSEVGKKGLVLDRDENWNYLYSNDKGLNKPGLGWVSSYMYGACSVIVMEELDPGRPLVRCSVFKWLRAGWSGINMVQNRHIYTGMERFGRTFRQIAEHPSLPPSDEMAHVFQKIQKLTVDELRNQTHRYFSMLVEKYGQDSSGAGKFISGLMTDKTYLSQLTQAQMRSILELEYLKHILGKARIINIGDLIALPSDNKLG